MKNKIVLIQIIALIFIVMQSCDSSLSDISLDDPSVINAHFNVEKQTNNGEESEFVTAYLTDKNLAFIELKDGEILLNDIKMSYSNFTKSYSSSVSVEPNTQYVFTIVLADDEEYNSIVRSPDYLFEDVIAPENLTMDDDLLIRWTGYDDTDELKIIYEAWSDLNSNYITIFETTTADDGSYTIDNSEMDYTHFHSFMVDKGRIQLLRDNEGELSASLRGGFIKARFAYFQEIDIVQ